MDKISKNSINRILLILIFAGISAIFLSVFSLATSFIYENNYIGWDSDIFLAMGKFAERGLIPYQDFFDHKGPFIIFIEWFGYLLGGRLGVFVIQIVFLTITLIGLYKILRLYCIQKTSIILAVASLLILNIYFDKGNLTEEFCLPFLVWSMYMAVKRSQYKWKGICIDFLIYGITFMVGAMTRLTNSLPVAIIVVISLTTVISKKQWRVFFNNLLWFATGNLILLIPTVIYFLKVNALKEMLYATFIYNFKHGFETKTLTDGEMFNMIILAIPLIIAFMVGIVAKNSGADEKSKSVVVLCLQSGVAVIFLLISRPYPHYYIVWVPTLVLGIALMTKLFKDKKKQSIIMVGLLGVVALVKVATATLDIYSALNSDMCRVFDEESKELVADIPMEDRDKVIAYNVKARFYLVTDILPCYKNFILQETHTGMDNVERQEFKEDLESMEAKYIITGTSNGAYSKFIEDNYKLEKTTRLFRVFVRE